MKALSKILSTLINLANYAGGTAVLLTLIFKWDFISIFYLKGMTSNESLIFNLIIFETALAGIGAVLCLLINEYEKSNKPIEFPMIFEILPILISVAIAVFSFQGTTAREKITAILGAVIYSLLSAVIIYSGARTFQLFPKNKEGN